MVQKVDAPAPEAAEEKPAVTPIEVVEKVDHPAQGKLIVQKSVKELEDELDGGTHESVEAFVKAHFEAKDANINAMAQALRMTTGEVWQTLKDAGYEFSEGVC